MSDSNLSRGALRDGYNYGTPLCVVGVDPGVRRWGVAVLRNGALDTAHTHPGVGAVVDALLDEHKRIPIFLAVLEAPPDNRILKCRLLEDVGVLMAALRAEGIALITVPCTRWKKALRRDAFGTKGKIKASAIQTFNLSDDLPQDAYDASLVALYGWDQVKTQGIFPWQEDRARRRLLRADGAVVPVATVSPGAGLLAPLHYRQTPQALRRIAQAIQPL